MSASRTTPETMTSRDRQRVLVIDDDPLFRNLLVSALRRDYLVSVASEGQEGFHKACEHPPDVAIIDIQMPGWDGLQTLKAFRANPLLTKVATVVLTSDASRETVLSAIQSGAQDYVIKTNFTKEELLRKLERFRQGGAKNATPGVPAPKHSRTTVSAASTPPEITPEPEPVAVGAATEPAVSEQPQKLQELLDNWE